MRLHLLLIPCLRHRCRMCRLMLPLLQWKTCRPGNLYNRRCQSAICASLPDRNRTCCHPDQCSLRCTYNSPTSHSLQVSLSSTDMMCTQRSRKNMFLYHILCRLILLWRLLRWRFFLLNSPCKGRFRRPFCTCLPHSSHNRHHPAQYYLRCIYSRPSPRCPQVSMNSSDSRHMCLMLLRRL